MQEVFQQVFGGLSKDQGATGALVGLTADERDFATDRAVEHFEVLATECNRADDTLERAACVALATELAYQAATGWMASWAKDGPDSFVASLSGAVDVTVKQPHRFCELVEEGCRAASTDRDFSLMVWPMTVPITEVTECLALNAAEPESDSADGMRVLPRARHRVMRGLVAVVLLAGLIIWFTARNQDAAVAQRILDSAPDDRLMLVEGHTEHWPVLCPLQGLAEAPASVDVEGARFAGTAGLPVLQSSRLRFASSAAADEFMTTLESMPERCGHFVYEPGNAPSFSGNWLSHDSGFDFASHNGISLRLDANTGPAGFEAGIMAFSHAVVIDRDIIHVTVVGLEGSEDLLEDLSLRSFSEVYPEITAADD